MLRSRKLKAPGPKELELCIRLWEEVYRSLCAQDGMKEVGCMAARGEEASMI